MKKIVVAVFVAVLSLRALSDNLVQWVAPDVKENGLPFAVSAGDQFTIYRDGVAVGAVDGLGAEYRDGIAADCVGHVYEINITENATGATSRKMYAFAPVRETCKPLAASTCKKYTAAQRWLLRGLKRCQ